MLVFEDEAAYGLREHLGALDHLVGGGAQPVEPRALHRALDRDVAVLEVVAAPLWREDPGWVRKNLPGRHCLSSLREPPPARFALSSESGADRARAGTASQTCCLHRTQGSYPARSTPSPRVWMEGVGSSR